jgi:hypothetical protein
MPVLPEDGWQKISRLSAGFWITAYFIFLIHAWRDTSGCLFPDLVNLMIHEAGHPLFSWGGNTLMLLGGTLGELIAPLLCAAAFFYQRQPLGFAFCGFWFFENFLYIGAYMADARTSALPLVGSEDSDWTLLFGRWNLLIYDQRIGHSFRTIGWLGMAAVVAWLAYRTHASEQPRLRPLQM